MLHGEGAPVNRVQSVEGSKSGPRSFVDLFATVSALLLSDRAQDSKQDSNGKNARDTWRHVNTRDPPPARLPIPSPILALVILTPHGPGDPLGGLTGA